MQVTLVQGGGFAGLVMTTTVDSASLAPADARRLHEAVSEVEFSDRPARRAIPDELSYELTVRDEDSVHTVRFGERDLEGPLQNLVTCVTTMPGRHEDVD